MKTTLTLAIACALWFAIGTPVWACDDKPGGPNKGDEAAKQANAFRNGAVKAGTMQGGMKPNGFQAGKFANGQNGFKPGGVGGMKNFGQKPGFGPMKAGGQMKAGKR